MKVQAIVKYFDKEEKRTIYPGEILEICSEERLNELLGNNKARIVCCQVIHEEKVTSLSEDNIAKDNSIQGTELKETEAVISAKEHKERAKKNAKRK